MEKRSPFGPSTCSERQSQIGVSLEVLQATRLAEGSAMTAMAAAPFGSTWQKASVMPTFHDRSGWLVAR